MKLTQLATTPQLVKLQLDDAPTIEEYGEPLEFYIHDRQPIANFIKVATLKPDNVEDIMLLVKDMIFDEHGELVIKEGTSLPFHVLSKVITKVVEQLGK